MDNNEYTYYKLIPYVNRKKTAIIKKEVLFIKIRPLLERETRFELATFSLEG